jgi:Ni/Fe-hydrogenase b-type cytochrome subunit
LSAPGGLWRRREAVMIPTGIDQGEPADGGADVALRAEPRHRLTTRIWHWLNALSVFILLMSGLMIFNAHPRLYWGEYGANFDPAWLELPRFPGWATIPSYYSLASARRWHLAFAWLFVLGLLVFMLASLWNRHVQRDLAPRRGELAPRHVWADIKQHARLQFATGEAALRYNILQKLSYLGVIFVLLPLLVMTGLTMSPGMNAAWPWLLDLFGGRQSARSIHFLCAAGLALFILVHLAMVVLSHPIAGIRAMITGRFSVPEPADRR